MTRAPARPLPDYRDDQRAWFDHLITHQWQTYSDPAWDATRRFEIDEIFRRISPRTVLDVGCGCGYHDLLIAARPGVDTVTGIDYSAESIRVAEEQYPHPKVRRTVGDVFAEAEDPHHFDLVCSFQVIEHLRHQQAFVAACARRTRPGGWVAIVTPNRLRLDNRIRRALRRDETLIDPMHFRELSRRELEQTAEGAGVQPIASFAHGLALTIPRLGRQVVPPLVGMRLGSILPAVASVICVIFQRVS